MTLRYVQVSQNDLQREFHAARLKLANSHPPLPMPLAAMGPDVSTGLPAVSQALATTWHLLEMYPPTLQCCRAAHLQPPHKPPDQDRHRTRFTVHTPKMSRDWPVKAKDRDLTHDLLFAEPTSPHLESSLLTTADVTELPH
jgi:hypothetical protein